MSIEPPLYTEPVIDENRIATFAWAKTFDGFFNGDAGTEWTPTFTNLTGSATITGRYYQLSQYITYFTVTVTPDTNTSATAGSTYIDNFPLSINGDGFCVSIANTAGGAIGVCDASTQRVYVPSWSSLSVPVTILGICEAR